jgi:hypothetical protein
LENAQGIGKKNLFSVDGTKIQDSQARTKNYEKWNKIKIHNKGTQIEIHNV